MKDLVKFDHAIGAEGQDLKGSAGGSLGVDGSDLVAQVQVQARYPIAKVIEPAMGVLDGLVDKLEALIPGDQKALAAAAKADARAALVKALSEQAPA